MLVYFQIIDIYGCKTHSMNKKIKKKYKAFVQIV